MPKRITRRKKFEEQYQRSTFWIDRDLLKAIDRLVGDEKGAKTEFINRALRREIHERTPVA